MDPGPTTYHEKAGNDVIPLRPTIGEALGDAELFITLMRGYAQAVDLRNRTYDPFLMELEHTDMSSEELTKRLEDSGG